ncbi:FliM/FliN family flagellar motor switch protein [Azospirillum sp. sgz302134]
MDGTGGETIWERVAALPPERLLPYLAAQAPQTMAALLLLVAPARAALLLAGLPEDARARALRCMAVTRPAAPEALADVERALRAELLDQPDPVSGADHSAEVARIVEALPDEQRQAALEALRRPVPPLPPAEPTTAHAEPPHPLPPLSPGLAAMLSTTVVVHDRLPMLEVAMDRFVRILSTTLRETLGRTAEVGLTALRSVRFGDWIEAVPGREPLLAVFRADPWDNHALFALHRDLLDGIGEILLGGNRETAGLRVAGRPLTGIDRAFADRMAQAALADLSTAFAPIDAVSFPLDRLEDNPRFAIITRLHNACFLADLTVAMDGRSGRLELLIPYATLEPVRPSLRRMYMGERFGKDPRWQAHLQRELARASVRVQAVAGTADLPLGVMLGWRVGTVFELDRDATEGVTLLAGGVAIARAALGRCGSRWAVGPRPALETSSLDPAPLPSVEAVSPPEQDFDAFHAVTVRVSAVVGEADMLVENLASLGQGRVVGLDRRVDDPIAILANDRLVARGELVVVEGRLAVRLREIAAAQA